MSFQLPATGCQLRIDERPRSELSADGPKLEEGSWQLEAVYG
jgi:hypothetical protein